MDLLRNTVLPVCALLAGFDGEFNTPSSQARPILPAERGALANGLRQVEVLGAAPDAASPGTVAAVLRVLGERQDRAFSAVPFGGGGQRVVIEFGQRAGGQGACTMPTDSGGPTLQMALTYCVTEHALSSVTRRSAAVTGPTHPRFARLLDRVMMALLEVRQPDRGSG